MTLKEIKSKYSVFNTVDNLYEIYEKHEYCGYLSKEKTKWIFHGISIDDPVQVRSLSDIDACIEHFKQRCDETWSTPMVFSPILAKSFICEYALQYMIKKFGWKPTGQYSATYIAGSNVFGTKIFTIEVDRNINDDKSCFRFELGGYYITSPEFTDYFEALNWIKNMMASTYVSTGVELLSEIINNNMEIKDMEETIMSKINFKGGTISVDNYSFNDYLIEVLEKQLESLKMNKTK